MRLELAEFPVTQLILGKRFRYDSGILEVNRQELLELILNDKRIREASLALALPGEKVRITGIRDIVEPRVKVNGGGQVFPGVLGPVAQVGAGTTHRLSGMSIVATAEYEGTLRSGTAAQRSGIIDMWGPGAEASRFSRLTSLVLVLRLAHGLSELEAHAAIQRAECEAAKKLAEATIGLPPRNVESYDLAKKADLPVVVLIQGCLTDSHRPHSGVSYYGLCIRDSLATVIHPNELMDGAVTINTARGVGYSPRTWDWQNHALSLGLYREHGKRLNFAGVILERIRFEVFHGKEVNAHTASQLAAFLGADGAFLAWLGGGNAFMDVMLTLKSCEQRGIKTVLITYEHSGKDGRDAPLLFYVPEADAVVSTGSRDRWLELPPAERVVGPYDKVQILSYPGAPAVPADGALTLESRDTIIGGLDNLGMQFGTAGVY
ncbi:MAG: hypothetical protein HY695_27485 [Deltaproteobacteria bacterium]|nr:hypothetical protein [Deltaproteobacteria bacterium]